MSATGDAYCSHAVAPAAEHVLVDWSCATLHGTHLSNLERVLFGPRHGRYARTALGGRKVSEP